MSDISKAACAPVSKAVPFRVQVWGEEPSAAPLVYVITIVPEAMASLKV